VTFIEVGYGSPNPAIYTNKIYSFLALDVEQVEKQSAHDAETIEVVLMPLDEVIAMTKKGDMINYLNISTIFFVLGYLNRVS
jgi:hypothetical protein